ncbi:MAG: hypothetical protein CM1200mP26_01330 [Acidimicrobiales bacterium]|nr:MAG: hypothetical protein CM1200mP26_01330 [Acidimicrobiales bacterium]
MVISVTSADTGEVTVSPAQLTFTSSNWNATQTVTVTGVNDSLTDGNQTTALTVSVVDASSDDAFDSVADQTVTVTTSDDDSPGVSVSESDGSTSTTESGSTDTFTVVLNTQPSSDVVISVTSANTGEATVSPAQLTFTSSNWDTAQTVTATGVDDSAVDGAQATSITLAIVDASSDNDYDPVADSTLTIINTDNDAPITTTTTLPPLGTVSISTVPSCSSVTLQWGVGTTTGLQSFSLASKAPGAGWVTHSTHLPTLARSASAAWPTDSTASRSRLNTPTGPRRSPTSAT